MTFISPVLNILSRSIRSAGKLLVRDFNELENLQSSIMSNEKFINKSVTKLQKHIEENLKKIRPNYEFDYIDNKNKDANSFENCWLICLIDGFSNFQHAIPHFCISVSLKENKEIVSSIVFDPIKDELFQAQKEKGCYLNNFRVKTSSKIFSSVLFSSIDKSFNFPKNLIDDHSKIKIFGSPLLDFCYLAAGRADLVYHSGYNQKYLETSTLILNEAGGKLIEVNIEKNISIVSNKKNEQKFKDLFKN